MGVARAHCGVDQRGLRVRHHALSAVRPARGPSLSLSLRLPRGCPRWVFGSSGKGSRHPRGEGCTVSPRGAQEGQLWAPSSPRPARSGTACVSLA